MVTGDRLVKLKRLVVGFHAAMDPREFSETGLNLQCFPIECCHHACRLLTVFLFEQSFTDIQKCVGSRPDHSTGDHLWLVVEGASVGVSSGEKLWSFRLIFSMR